MGKSTFLQDFKAFAMKGNVVDMAVGVIIGGAFGKIVSSVVADIIMPPLGLLIGGVNFTDLKWVMKAAEYGADGKETAAAVTLNYGNFLQATFDFLIIAFSIFLFIKLITKLTQKKAEAPAAPQRTLQRQHGRLPPFGTACGRGIRRIPLRRRLVFLDARRIAGPRVHRLRTAQRLPPPRRGHDDAGRTDGRTLRGGVADPAIFSRMRTAAPVRWALEGKQLCRLHRARRRFGRNEAYERLWSRWCETYRCDPLRRAWYRIYGALPDSMFF